MADGTLKVGTITTSSGSGTITLGQSGETIAIPSGATLDLSNATQTGVGGTNTPAWLVNLSGNQTVATATDTTLQFNTEQYDTDSAYNTGTYTFTVPSGKAGKYYIFAHVSFADFPSTTSIRPFLRLLKNGNQLMSRGEFQKTNDASASWNGFVSTVADLSESDALTVFIRHNAGTNQTVSSLSYASNFGGYKLIGA
jgi:hypothetical protein